VNKECGDNGCGESCGECEKGDECSGGLCVPYEEPVDLDIQGQTDDLEEEDKDAGSSDPVAFDVTGDAGGGGSNSCPPGQRLRYGKCVSLGDAGYEDDSSVSGGCGVSPTTPSAPWLLLLLLALAALRRRQIAN